MYEDNSYVDNVYEDNTYDKIIYKNRKHKVRMSARLVQNKAAWTVICNLSRSSD